VTLGLKNIVYLAVPGPPTVVEYTDPGVVGTKAPGTTDGVCPPTQPVEIVPQNVSVLTLVATQVLYVVDWNVFHAGSSQ